MNPRRTHSVALVVASATPAFVIPWSVDPFTPLLVGIPLAALLQLALPRESRMPSRAALISLGIATVTIGLASLFYAVPHGTEYFRWGFAHISDGSISVAVTAVLRVAVLALPAMAIAPVVSAHEFLATCAMRRVIPDRIALATLIALRLVPVIAADLDETRQARRAVGRTSTPISIAATTLVIALRRAVRMSDIAEVRGFSRHGRRWRAYRPLRWTDWLVMIVAIAIGVIALGATAAGGAWNGAIA